MKNTIFLIGICCLLFSCQKENEDRIIRGYFPTPVVTFSILDKDGNDLLNPYNPNSYKHNDIALYKDSLCTIKRCENYDIRYYTLEDNTKWCIEFWAYCDSKKIRPEFNDTICCATNYLKLNDTTIDTVYSEYIISGRLKALCTILYNGDDIFHTRGYAIK